MEDASDFSWDAAKASHAVVLTNMEADRLQWSDTEKAQRHITPGQSTVSKGPVNKKIKNSASKNGIICKFFQESTCRFMSHHRTAEQFYRPSY